MELIHHETLLKVNACAIFSKFLHDFPVRLSLLNIFYNVESIFFSDYVLLVVMDQYKQVIVANGMYTISRNQILNTVI